MKVSEQKRRGIKNIKAPSELDWQVHNLLAGRKPDGRSKIKKCKSPPCNQSKSLPVQTSQMLRQWQQRASSIKSEQVGKVEDFSSDEPNDLGFDSDSDLVDLLTPQQYQSTHQNGFHDALEPMTIIEEYGRNHTTTQQQLDLTMEDDPADDEYTFNRHVTSSENVNSDASDSADINQLQRELLLHDIQLKLIQRQNEDERMGNERELFHKQSILLDLQTKRAEIELQQLQLRSTQSNATPSFRAQ